jgi:S-sulfo-L-cysteine synthase (3-phospho-L-serine-dependent)
MDKPWLVFVESNLTGTGRLLFSKSVIKGFRPILLTLDPSFYHYVKEDGIDVLQVNTLDQNALLKVCRELATKSKLAGVTSCVDFFLENAVNVAHQLRLPGYEPSVIRDCCNKYTQRLRLQSSGVDIPKFFLASSTKEANIAAQHIGFPVVVKPVSLAGSMGVKLCKDIDEVESHANALFQQENLPKVNSLQQILIEEAVIGPEYSVEVFGTKIIGITKKYLGAYPYFVEVGHDHPTVLPHEIEKSIHLSVMSTLNALNWKVGPAHVELRFSETGPKIIEVNPRIGGDYIFELLRLAYDIDIVSETINFVTGTKLNLDEKTNRYASIRFFTSPTEGVLRSIEGLDLAKQVNGVTQVQFYYQEGDYIRLYGDYRDRVGHVIAYGETFKDALTSVNSAHEAIMLTVQTDSNTKVKCR